MKRSKFFWENVVLAAAMAAVLVVACFVFPGLSLGYEYGVDEKLTMEEMQQISKIVAETREADPENSFLVFWFIDEDGFIVGWYDRDRNGECDYATAFQIYTFTGAKESLTASTVGTYECGACYAYAVNNCRGVWGGQRI